MKRRKGGTGSMKIDGQELVAGSLVRIEVPRRLTLWDIVKRFFGISPPEHQVIYKRVEGKPERRPPIYPAEWPRNLEKTLAESGKPVPIKNGGSTMIDIGTTEPPDGFVLDDKDDMGEGRYQ